jgi:hypothetical protein
MNIIILFDNDNILLEGKKGNGEMMEQAGVPSRVDK